MNALPTWVQWYLRPAGEYTTFTLLPWAGFVFAGGAVGVLVDASNRGGSVSKLHSALAAAGAALIALGLYTATRGAASTHATFWTSSPAFFAIRVGVLMLTLCALFAIEHLPVLSRPARGERVGAAARPPGWLVCFGRNSLFVYWIHVELVYGYATWPIHRQLPVAGTIAACAAFSVLMYGAVVVRHALAARWRARSGAAPAFQAAREGVAP
jgi:surface polysaccharide O-acyltransferase-like enzyme